MGSLKLDSTRGGEKGISASEAIIKGIADDGGLFVPQYIPSMNDINTLMNMDYKNLAANIIGMFLTDFTSEELLECTQNAYNEKFDTDIIAPVKKVGGRYFLELFHGPTIAFKDMALSILPHLLKLSVKKQNNNKKIIILTATSGDTGKAALEGFTDIDGVKIIVFYPEEGVSEIQKRQMTTHWGSNTYVVGIKGNFDDAQNGVKKIFTDSEFQSLLDRNNMMFSSANSINIGRLIPQVVYYYHAYLSLVKMGEIKPGEAINITVPTGNFGNILAAYYAKEMGLPINKLICASNENKVLYDFFNTGIYDRKREFITTISPSMDILISSNLERLLYVLCGNNPDMLRSYVEKLSSQGKYEVNNDMKEKMSAFYGGYASEEETRQAIMREFKSNKYLIDTHTAVACAVHDRYVEETEDDTKTLIVSTASPFKFTSAVMTSIDENYGNMDDFQLVQEMHKLSGIEIPSAIEDIENREIVHNTVCTRENMKDVVSTILKI